MTFRGVGGSSGLSSRASSCRNCAISTTSAAVAKRIDATGKYVIPGGIDVHTHMELPFGGTFASDDFYTGTVAAAFGGTTSIVDFAVQGMGEPLETARDAWLGKARGKAAIDYGLHVIVRDVTDKVLKEMDVMVKEGDRKS